MKNILLSILIIPLILSCSKDDSDPSPDNTSNNSNNTNVSTNCQSVQCVSLTQQNVRCQRMTTYCNSKCWQHQ